MRGSTHIKGPRGIYGWVGGIGGGGGALEGGGGSGGRGGGGSNILQR